SPSEATYLRFDAPSLPAGTTATDVARATLKLFINTVAKPGRLDVYQLAAPWSERTVTGATAPALGVLRAQGVTVAATDEAGFFTVDMTDMVRVWLSVAPPYGLALVSNPVGISVLFDPKANSLTRHEAGLDM